MSEAKPVYQDSEAFNIEGFRTLPCSQHKDSPDYQPPTPEQVKTLRNYLNLSQVACARLTGASYQPDKGSSTVRKWETATDNRNHKPIPYAAWRLMLAAACIVDLQEDLIYSQSTIPPLI